MDVARLRENFAHIAMHGDELPLFFYSDLFIKHPEVRDLFPISMAAQRGHFVEALVKIVSQVDRVAEVTVYLEALGRDHRKFGAVLEHYDIVGDSLLSTLEHFSGPTWTPELAADWRTAYDLIGSIMISAARADERKRPGLVGRDGRVVRTPKLRRIGADGAAGLDGRVRAWPVGVDRDAGPA